MGADMAESVIQVVKGDYPPADLPTIFADGALNLSHSPTMVKFYLFRTDPHLEGKPTYQNQVIAQIVMPIGAFVQMQTFFDLAIQKLIDLNYVTKEQVETTRNSHRQTGS